MQAGPPDLSHLHPAARCCRTLKIPTKAALAIPVWGCGKAYAALRNLVTGAFRHAGFASIAHARHYYGRDDQRILTLYG